MMLGKIFPQFVMQSFTSVLLCSNSGTQLHIAACLLSPDGVGRESGKSESTCVLR